jgi:thioester reductase-like protein
MNHSAVHTNDPLSSTAWTELRSQLRDFAVQHLPQAAVPSKFVVLPDLPKLANGKVDRKKLTGIRRDVGLDKAHTPPTTPQELRIARIWADLLSVNRIGLDDNFFELGGNSLMAAQMAARLRADSGVAIHLRKFFENPTVARLAELFDGQARSVPAGPRHPLSISADELLAEARLPEDIFPDARATAPAQPPYNAVFLTGGSGYTGAHLIREILMRSATHIFVLVRGTDQDHGHARIRKVMERFGVWREDAKERLTPVIGDLSRPYFGLDRTTYLHLAQQADVIIHNGALSSYAMSYHALKQVNVLGTQEVLRLACRNQIKPVHYVSSLGIYPIAPVSRWAELEVTESEGVTGGYVQTKWVGDSMMLQAGRRGLPICVYRPGLITGAQDTGAGETDTFINAIVKGSVQLGAFPTNTVDQSMEIVPVDFCAAAIAHIALGGAQLGKVFNLPGARSMTAADLSDGLEAFGYRLRRLPFPQWYRELGVAIESGEENELARFLTVLDEYQRVADKQIARPNYDTTNLRSALNGSGIVCSPPDRALWDRYLRWFIATGFMPSPEAALASTRDRRKGTTEQSIADTRGLESQDHTWP